MKLLKLYTKYRLVLIILLLAVFSNTRVEAIDCWTNNHDNPYGLTDRYKLFDGDLSTYWMDWQNYMSNREPIYLEFKVGSKITVPEYYLFTAPENTQYNPTSWKLLAKVNQADEKWDTLSVVDEPDLPIQTKTLSKAYVVDPKYASTGYSYFRYEFFGAEDGSRQHFAIGEFCIFDDRGVNKLSQIGKPAPKKDGVYQISNLGHLFGYASNPDADAILLNDIDVDVDWKTFNFSGHTFDGNGHSLKGVHTSGASSYLGFIAKSKDATIKNLSIINAYYVGNMSQTNYAGGIVAYSEGNTRFINCHSNVILQQYRQGNYMGGICGYDPQGTDTYTSCLFTGKMINASNRAAMSNSTSRPQNCVCLEGSATKFMQSDYLEGVFVTQDDLDNGMAGWYLNNGVTDGSQVWYQRVGQDAFPYPLSKGNDTLYAGYRHGEAIKTAANDVNRIHAMPYKATAQAEDSGNHGKAMVDGVCIVCGLSCDHSHYTNAICDVCKYICPHGVIHYVNGFGLCVMCSLEVSKSYEAAKKGYDGYYEVTNAGQLYWMAGQIASDKYLKFRLVNNIVDNENVLNPDGTLRDGEQIKHEWTSYERFLGTFDGCGHTISGLYGEPLFGDLRDASVSNLGITDSYFCGKGFLGSVASEAVNSDVRYCYSTATVDAESGYPEFFMGGLIGRAESTNVSDSYYTGTTRGGAFCGYNTSSYFSRVYTTASRIGTEACAGESQHVDVSVEDFASGSVAFSLNDEITDGTQHWFQKLGEDKTPVLLATKKNWVYNFVNCQDVLVYENAPDMEGHLYLDKGTNFKCKYCDETRTAALDTNDYLSFTARGTNALIGIVKHGDAPALTLMYSPDKQTWTKKIISSTEDILSIPVDETYYFRRSPDDASNTLNTDAENYWSFTSTGNATVEADGSILSLISPIPDDAVMGDYAFYGLFRDWAKLSKAPELPATGALPKYAYTDIFRNCPLIKDLTISFNDYVATGCLDGWLTGTADGTTGNLHIMDELRGEYIPLPANWQVVCEDVHDFVVEKDKLGNAVWAWTETPLSAKIKLVCTKNPNHTDAYAALPGELTSLVTTQPSCTLDGVRTYTATVTYDGVEYQSSHDAAEPALGHDYQYGVCSRCGDNLDHYDTFTIDDGTPYLISKECTVDELTYSRGYTPSVWSAWFTPFAVSVAELEAVGLTAAYIEGIHQYDDDNDGMIDRTSIEAIKITNGRLRAGTPYIVKASEGFNPHLRLSMVTMASANDLVPIETSTATLMFNFRGTYSGMTAEEVNAVGNLYSLSPKTGSLVRRTGKIQPLRWYCSITNKGSMYDDEPVAASVLGAIYIHVKGEEDTSTGIRTIYPENSQTMERVDSGIFDLGGTKLPAPQRGKINVVKGKKFVK